MFQSKAGLVAGVLAGCLLWYASARADPLPALDQATRKAWTAVGQVNVAGYRNKSSCTGTLIAPDLVLTAAHCVDTPSGPKRVRHFVAGWDRGTFAAHRTAAEILMRPEYASATGTARFQYDIALIRLNRPIDTATVTPIPPGRGLFENSLAVLGYHRKRPHVVNGRFDCAAQGGSNAAGLVLDCEVIAGNSGGPVISRDGTGWAVTAVIAGRINGTRPQALAVPVGNWVMLHWRAAMVRAAGATPSGG